VAVQLTKSIKFTIDVGDETVTLICKQPTAIEQQKFLKARFDTKKRGKLKDKSIEAAIEFADLILLDVENVEYEGTGGKMLPLTNKVEGWKDLLPPNWKVSLAGRFSEPEIELGN